jgi:hypothetical protein
MTPAFAIAFIMSVTFLGYQAFGAPILPMWPATPGLTFPGNAQALAGLRPLTIECYMER